MADVGNNTVTNGAKDLLGKKYGPLPFGAWLIIIAATAYVARRFVKGQQASKDAEANLSPEGYVVDSQGTEFPSIYKGTGGGVYGGVGSVYGAGSSGSSVTPVTEVNNEGWLRRAAEKLAAAGQFDNITVQKALQTYISGGDLDQRQSAIVNQAIKAEGQPPINVNPGKQSTGPWANVLGVVTPAGNAGQFLEYTDGSLIWIRDPGELSALRTARPELDLTPRIMAIGDARWRQADVYQSQSKDYLAAEAREKSAWKNTEYGPSQYTIYQ